MDGERVRGTTTHKDYDEVTQETQRRHKRLNEDKTQDKVLRRVRTKSEEI